MTTPTSIVSVCLSVSFQKVVGPNVATVEIGLQTTPTDAPPHIVSFRFLRIIHQPSRRYISYYCSHSTWDLPNVPFPLLPDVFQWQDPDGVVHGNGDAGPTQPLIILSVILL